MVEQPLQQLREGKKVVEGLAAGIELDEHVDVTVRSSLVPQNRTEKGETADAKSGDLFFGALKVLDDVRTIE